jgi:hypothetical protein
MERITIVNRGIPACEEMVRQCRQNKQVAEDTPEL